MVDPGLILSLIGLAITVGNLAAPGGDRVRLIYTAGNLNYEDGDNIATNVIQSGPDIHCRTHPYIARGEQRAKDEIVGGGRSVLFWEPMANVHRSDRTCLSNFMLKTGPGVPPSMHTYAFTGDHVIQCLWKRHNFNPAWMWDGWKDTRCLWIGPYFEAKGVRHIKVNMNYLSRCRVPQPHAPVDEKTAEEYHDCFCDSLEYIKTYEKVWYFGPSPSENAPYNQSYHNASMPYAPKEEKTLTNLKLKGEEDNFIFGACQGNCDLSSDKCFDMF